MAENRVRCCTRRLSISSLVWEIRGPHFASGLPRKPPSRVFDELIVCMAFVRRIEIVLCFGMNEHVLW